MHFVCAFVVYKKVNTVQPMAPRGRGTLSYTLDKDIRDI